MDRLIKRFAAEPDGDLSLCRDRGIAYQADMSAKVSYDAGYFNKCASYEDKEIALKINAERIALVKRWFGDGPVVDIGIGSGEFIKKRGANTFGFDVNPVAGDWLRDKGLWREDFSGFKAFTFWDVIEHVEDPHLYFQSAQKGSYLFTCLPVVRDVGKIRGWKHYRPREHLYYWTRESFINWMALYGFRLLETHNRETEAGRDDIASFAFCRDLPGLHDTIDLHRQANVYARPPSYVGHFDLIAKLVLKVNPGSVLDYGSGRSDLVAHFWGDGRRRIAKYDPGVPEYQVAPEEVFDLAICCDVLPHVRVEDADRVIDDIARRSKSVIFTFPKLRPRDWSPDGDNPLAVIKDEEWRRWIEAEFGEVRLVESADAMLLLARTGS